MTGAPNCQNPVWSPEELAIIKRAWDIWEAWEEYRATFGKGRSMRAIVSCWCRLHPKIALGVNLQEKRALDELERVTA